MLVPTSGWVVFLNSLEQRPEFIALPGGDGGQKSVVGALRSVDFRLSFMGMAGAQAAAAEAGRSVGRVGIIDSPPPEASRKAAAGASNCGAAGFQRGRERGDLSEKHRSETDVW